MSGGCNNIELKSVPCMDIGYISSGRKSRFSNQLMTYLPIIWVVCTTFRGIGQVLQNKQECGSIYCLPCPLTTEGMLVKMPEANAKQGYDIIFPQQGQAEVTICMRIRICSQGAESEVLNKR